MNWKNLEKICCPKCGKKLQFRLKNQSTHIRAREFSREPLHVNYYFCFPCDFQIREEKLLYISEKNIKIDNTSYLDDFLDDSRVE